MKTTSRLPRWLWGSVVGIGLVVVSIALVYLLKSDSGVAPLSQEGNFSNETTPEDKALQTTSAEPLVVVETDSTLTLTFFNGSIEEACGIHEYPRYWDYENDSEDSDKEELLKRAIASKECREALDAHVGTMNPYLWGNPFVHVRQFSFVLIEDPLTFDRIFADPSEDFARVQNALTRTECLLENGTATNFELNESCNADALLNYAVLNKFCFSGGSNSPVYFQQNPTPELSRIRWVQDLEQLWVNIKCEETDAELELTEAMYPDLTKLLSSLTNSNSLGLQIFIRERQRRPGMSVPEILPPRFLISTLIEMAARLGDEAAALTDDGWFGKEGFNLGRFQELESNPTWQELRWKREPNRDRLLQTFEFLPTAASMDIEFDWEWLVGHLCEPPFHYHELSLSSQTALSYEEWQEESSEPQSCRAVINELYIDGDLSDSVLEVIDRFERTAMRLDLYH